MERKTWKDWVLDYIRSTRRCPGEITPKGVTHGSEMTREEFEDSVEDLVFHRHDDCGHYADDLLEVSSGLQGMRQISTDDSLAVKVAEDYKVDLLEVERSKKLSKAREALHSYVDRIRYTHSGKVVIPEPLTGIEKYIKELLGE